MWQLVVTLNLIVIKVKDIRTRIFKDIRTLELGRRSAEDGPLYRLDYIRISFHAFFNWIIVLIYIIMLYYNNFGFYKMMQISTNMLSMFL